MAIGDVVSDLVSVPSGGVVDMRPPSGNEWIIHNVVYGSGSSIQYNKVSASGSILTFDTDSTMGGRFNGSYHCTNDIWYQLENSGSASVLVSYDGVQTK